MQKSVTKRKYYHLSDDNWLSLLTTLRWQKYWSVRYTIHGYYKSELLGLYPDISLLKERELVLELKYKYCKLVLHEDIKP